MCALGGLVVTTVEGTGAVRKPDPAHLLHTLTASRFAAPIDAHASPVLTHAVEAAATKRRSVKAAVERRARQNDGASGRAGARTSPTIRQSIRTRA